VSNKFSAAAHILHHYEGLITQVLHQEPPCSLVRKEVSTFHFQRTRLALTKPLSRPPPPYPPALSLPQPRLGTTNQMCRIIYPLWGCGHAFSEPELSRWGPSVHTILCERAWEQYHNGMDRIGKWGFQCGYYQLDPRPCGSWEGGQEILTKRWCPLCTAERDTPTSQGMSGSTSWREICREAREGLVERERWWYWGR